AQVCDGPVCVTKARQSRLDDLAGPGKEALRLLRGALGDRAPVAVRESTALRGIGDTPERSRDSVFIDFDDASFAAAEGKQLTRALVGQGLAPACNPSSAVEFIAVESVAPQSIAASWALGEDLRPIDETKYSAREQADLAGPVWKKFISLPKSEQRQRIGAMHAAAVSCSGDPLDVLAGGVPR
ncbi:MAG TPA: hypothetical protein VFH94_10620, partial [Streptomyces sp.]|nr:hypothetical protein [Streptomyces sp.]